MKVLYTTQVTAVGGREGTLKSADGVIDLKVEIPKEMGGKGGPYTNPEQLFAAGYASCFDSALNLVARMEKVELTKSEITAEVSLGKTDEGAYKLAVKMIADIQGVDREKAQELLEKTHQICPYSNATRGNIDVTLELK